MNVKPLSIALLHYVFKSSIFLHFSKYMFIELKKEKAAIQK